MAQVINTNSLSLLTQNNLNKSQSSLSSAIERLSSGLRINSAKDDAAGQAIANRFTSNIKGLTQASRNANDGISIAQTTEGALSEINNNLQRVRELSVQAANGSNSDSDLSSIQAEIKQRLDEIDRVSGQTQFNGVKVLASDNKLSIQVGANDNEKITLDLKEITSKTLGLTGFSVTGDTAATKNDLVKSFGATGKMDYTLNTNTYQVNVKSGAVTDKADDSAVYIGANSGEFVKNANNTQVVTNNTTAAAVAAAAKLTAVSAGGTFDWNGTTWTASTDANTNGYGAYKATIDGNEITLTVTGTAADHSDAALTVTGGSLYTESANKLTTHATNLAAKESDLLQKNAAGAGGALTAGGVNYTVDAAGTVTNAAGKQIYIKNAGASDAKLVTQDDASEATRNQLDVLDKAISQVDSFRGALGAVQNRFDSTITNLGNTINNLSSARSRIEDADYATEVSNMSRAQILQQAGTSVLAQANQTTQNVLSLLR